MSAEIVSQTMKLVASMTKLVMDTAIKNAYLAGAIDGMRRERSSINKKLHQMVQEKHKSRSYSQVTGTSTPQRQVPAITRTTRKIP